MTAVRENLFDRKMREFGMFDMFDTPYGILVVFPDRSHVILGGR